MAQKLPLSVVIIAKNEEAVIEESLKSVYDWADEIIVIDDCSTDKTVEVSKKYAKVFTRKMENEGRHRNWAYAQAKNLWVLSLDADEQVLDDLKNEIGENIKNTTHACFDMPLRNFIGGYWVRYGGWYPAPKVRLFRRDKFKYEEVEVHPRVFCEGTCGHLQSDLIHKGYPDIEHLIASMNRQTTLEAKKWIHTNRKMSLGHIIWRIVDRFFRRYLRKKAYKDGMYGFVIAFLDSLYQLLSYVKYKEMLRMQKKT